MKTVFFIRHAKSSWDDPMLDDIDRPLNKRGIRDAPFMATLLKAKEEKMDLLLSSPANRALSTARYFAPAFGFADADVKEDRRLYLASLGSMLDVIGKQEDSLNKICVFGHNPTMTDLANYFGDDYVSNVPTCAIVKVETDAASWKEMDKDNSRLIEIHYPKQYF